MAEITAGHGRKLTINCRSFKAALRGGQGTMIENFEANESAVMADSFFILAGRISQLLAQAPCRLKTENLKLETSE
jgi:hypothetical protein